MNKIQLNKIVRYVNKELDREINGHKFNNIGIALPKLSHKDFEYLRKYFLIQSELQIFGYVHFERLEENKGEVKYDKMGV